MLIFVMVIARAWVQVDITSVPFVQEQKAFIITQLFLKIKFLMSKQFHKIKTDRGKAGTACLVRFYLGDSTRYALDYDVRSYVRAVCCGT